MLINKLELSNSMKEKTETHEVQDTSNQLYKAGLVITKDSVYEYDINCIKAVLNNNLFNKS